MHYTLHITALLVWFIALYNERDTWLTLCYIIGLIYCIILTSFVHHLFCTFYGLVCITICWCSGCYIMSSIIWWNVNITVWSFMHYVVSDLWFLHYTIHYWYISDSYSGQHLSSVGLILTKRLTMLFQASEVCKDSAHLRT